MKILFISTSGESLPIVYRLRREGTDARIYLHGKRYVHNYDGLVPKLTLGELRAAAAQSEVILFDITRSNEKFSRDPDPVMVRKDEAILKMFGVSIKSPSVYGPIADKLRRHHLVIGTSEWSENLELDRWEGSRLAKKVGLKLPEAENFKSIRDGVEFLKTRAGEEWVLKPHNNEHLHWTYVENKPGQLINKLSEEIAKEVGGDKFEYMLQLVVDGHEISTECWWDGDKWLHHNHTIEEKRLMNNNRGEPTGCQSSVVWIDSGKGLLWKEFEKLAPMVKSSGHIGPVDANCIVAKKDHQPYFLEWSVRFGYDALFCLLYLLRSDLTSFFTNGFRASWHEGYSGSERISIPPYPRKDHHHLDKMAKGVRLAHRLSQIDWFWAEDVLLADNKLQCAGADAILGVAAGRGATVDACSQDVYDNVNKLDISAYLQCRSDLGERAKKALNAYARWGITV